MAAPVMKSLGIGKFAPCPPGPRTTARAESIIASACAFTATAEKSVSTGVRDGVKMAAESYTAAMLPIA